MKYAIVESGGKQYKAVEGQTIDVDRLPVDVGAQVALKQVLLAVDGKEITIGTPTVSGIQVSTTVVSHIKGPKIVVFKYSPKKRIRVRSGHRQQYTRLTVDVIGKPGETRKVAKVEKAEPAAEKAPARTVKKSAETAAPKKAETAKKATPAKAEKTAAKKTPAGKGASKAPQKKTTGSKAPAKTSDTKKTATKAPAKKPSTTETKKTTK